jgi:SAM-dependent methyltransferase
MEEVAEKRTSAERLVHDYEALFEPLTARFCRALLDLAGGVCAADRVIDVAAGTGALSLPVARTGASLLACDISRAAVQRLSDRLRPYANAEARILDGEALDVPDESFDAAFSAFGVMLFPDFRAGLRELVRVTRPGGRVGIVVWARPEGGPAAGPFRAAYAAAFPDRPPPPFVPGTAALSDPAVLRQEVEAAGCTAVDLRAAEFAWTVPASEWVGENTERLFRDHPLWTALPNGDRERLRGALVDEATAASGRAKPARAYLAWGRKRLRGGVIRPRTDRAGGVRSRR